jgi:hypothetical protein
VSAREKIPCGSKIGNSNHRCDHASYDCSDDLTKMAQTLLYAIPSRGNQAFCLSFSEILMNQIVYLNQMGLQPVGRGA